MGLITQIRFMRYKSKVTKVMESSFADTAAFWLWLRENRDVFDSLHKSVSTGFKVGAPPEVTAAVTLLELGISKDTE